MINAGSSTGWTVNINFHSTGGSFHDYPAPISRNEARHIYPFRGMLRVWSGFPGACSVRTCVLVPPPASCGEERRMCAIPLNCHITSGSFQRDSAVLTLKGCHSTRSQPVMATGRPLVISLARYAAPIRQYSVFPQSAPWPLERIV